MALHIGLRPVGPRWLALARTAYSRLLGVFSRRDTQQQQQHQQRQSVPQTGLLKLRRSRRKAAMNNTTPVRMPCSIQGKACYVVWKNQFIIDERYVPIRALGRGAYGMVMSARDQITGEKARMHLTSMSFDAESQSTWSARRPKLAYVSDARHDDACDDVSCTTFCR